MTDAMIHIDCDADPFVPQGLKANEHCRMGKIELVPNKIQLSRFNTQIDREMARGNELLEIMNAIVALNANALDFFLANQESIPEAWKYDENKHRRWIFFWGTIYEDHQKNLCVRFLNWNGTEWMSGAYWIKGNWGSEMYVARI